ncbi:acyl-CoA N-acyltransferase [Apiospora kogelbergensis]|uniref:Acyl-CoA N-acyltransferase n=1 Tax=Apiospora kogelbergensis TaxID=1337665 RepID=A0AAW0QCQ9_9PEZI
MVDTVSTSQRCQVAATASGQRFGVTIVPRTTDDLAALARIFKATFEATGYPVEGPPALDSDAAAAAAPALVEYFSGIPSQELGGFVAVDEDAAMAMGHSSSSSNRNIPTFLPRRKVLGHVSLRRVGHQSLEAELWNTFIGKASAAATPGAGDDCLWGVSRLAIDPTVQKRGVGGRLMDHVEQEARGAGKTLVLGVLDKDVAAIRMYERRGWVRFGQEEGFAGRDGRLWTMYYYGLGSDPLPS